MSDYGRLWQKVWEIRQELKTLVSHANTNTLKDAQRTYADSIITARDAGDVTRADRIEYLLADWAYLERKMAVTDT